jgi:ADP-ribose pyrophosphatase YjhB (NUDIX family)
VTPRHCLGCGHRLARVSVDGRQRWRCPRCGFTFYGNPAPAAVGLVVHRGRVLLTLRARPPYAGTWDLPGGFLEAGERPDEALRREIREELGIGARRLRLLGFATDRYGPRGAPILTIVYRVTPASTRARPADDVAAARWFPVRAIPYRAVAFPGLRRLLRRVLRGS